MQYLRDSTVCTREPFHAEHFSVDATSECHLHILRPHPVTVSMVIRASDTFANLAATSAIVVQDIPLADTYYEDEGKEDAAEADNMADAAAMLSKRSFRSRAQLSFSHG